MMLPIFAFLKIKYVALKKIIILFAFTIIAQHVLAQLPNIEVVTALNRNIVSWMNPYGDLYAITVQRSSDSLKNFTTIGTIKKPKKGGGAFSDDKPMIGKNFYQLIIVFNPEVEWFSKKKGIFVDSSSLANSMKADTNAASNKAKEQALEANPTLAIEEIKPTFTFTPSTHVYTNTYTGHININVENAVGKRYSLVFYGNDKKESFRIDRISYDSIVLDKHNFNGKGTFSFSLLESGKEVEKGFVNVY
jgi:hypothetical protein